MKLGYFTLTDNPPAYGDSRKDPGRLLEEVMDQCIHAETVGLNSVWVPEHHFGLFGVLPSAPVFLASVAARTKRVKLGPATVLLPVQHPIRVAEEFALLDLLSNGRAMLSAGRGYDAREYAAFGVDFAQSQEIFFESLEVIRKAWSNETVSHLAAPGPATISAHIRGLFQRAYPALRRPGRVRHHLRAIRRRHDVRQSPERGGGVQEGI